MKVPRQSHPSQPSHATPRRPDSNWDHVLRSDEQLAELETEDMFSILVLTLVVVSSVLGVIQDTSYPLHPSETGRYFTTIDANRDPQPFFWQADTAWVLFHRLTLDEAEVYLEDRRAKGFTVILAVGVTQFGYVRSLNCRNG